MMEIDEVDELWSISTWFEGEETQTFGLHAMNDPTGLHKASA